jgi:ATPase family AAA domain-containing protein 3A/B
MFGGWSGKKKEETAGEVALNLSTPKEEKGSKSSGGGGGSVHGFDPSALERAAKAAKELDQSRNAKAVLESLRVQEMTKQKEHEADRAKYQAHQQELAIRRVHEEEESAARTLERQAQLEKSKADYQDQLQKKRMIEQLNAQKQMQDDERHKNEASIQRQEEMRRKTLEHEAALRQQTEMARIKAETEGKIQQERTNHDLILEKKRAEAKEYRETVLEAIKLAGSTIGAGVQEFVSDRQKLANVAGTLTMLGFGLYTAKTSVSVIGRFVESRLGKPSLVRETSRTSVLQIASHPFTAIKAALKSNDAGQALKNIVLETSLEFRLRRIAVSTANTKKNRAPYRHMLLHGPPGTGECFLTVIVIVS